MSSDTPTIKRLPGVACFRISAAKKYHGEFAVLNFPGTDYRSAASSFNKKKPIRLPAM